MILTLLLSSAFAQEAPPIVNGSTTQDFEAVGALTVNYQGGFYSFCSGTLIHPEYVLTAAHCVDAAYSYYRQGVRVDFTLGHNVGTNSGVYETVKINLFEEHPDYDPQNLRYDIGILGLKKAMSQAEPVPLNTKNINGTWQGVELDYVGFGITDDNREDSGKKRTASIAINSWDSQFIYGYDSVSNLCSGDSGGAAIRMGNKGSMELVGVNSFVFGVNGSDPCDGGGSGATRVDKSIDWIESIVPLEELEEEEQEEQEEQEEEPTGDSPGDNPDDDPLTDDDVQGLPDRPGLEMEPMGGCSTSPAKNTPIHWAGLLLLGLLWRRRQQP